VYINVTSFLSIFIALVHTLELIRFSFGAVVIVTVAAPSLKKFKFDVRL